MVETQATGEIVLPQKSTNGRLKPIGFPGWLRISFRVLGHVAPGRASALARHLLFTPRAFPSREEETAVLDRGTREVLATHFGDVVCRTWGTGPAVLLVHGWSGRSGQMTAMVDPLCAAGFKVVAPDLPAHGESAGTTASVVHFSAAIAAAGRKFGPFHAVIAHSLGTSGTILALAEGLSADRVVFFAPPARFDLVWQRFRDGLGIKEPIWSRIRAEAESWLRVDFETIVPAVLAPRMRMPLLVIHDGLDREIPVAEGEELVRLWPGARLTRTEGLGHARILRDPAAVTAAVAFLAGDPT